MAQPAAEELIDWIRHVFRSEDDTGICCRVLPRSTRRPRRCQAAVDVESSESQDSLDEDGQDSEAEGDLEGFYSRHFNASPSFHGARAKADPLPREEGSNHRNDGASSSAPSIVRCADQKPQLSAEDAKRLFEQEGGGEKEEKETERWRKLTRTSLTARLLSAASSSTSEITPSGDSNQFEEYAKFEALSGDPASKTITIVVPWSGSGVSNHVGEGKNGSSRPTLSTVSNCCSIPIRVINSAHISDLIGLACYVYTRLQLQPPCLPPHHYSLYLAEEDCEYDTELPPQDPYRLVGDCGFPHLAMVPNRDVPQHQASQLASARLISVYSSDGTKLLEMGLDSSMEGRPLQWLFDESLGRKRELDSGGGVGENDSETRRRNAEHFLELPYILEPLHIFDSPGQGSVPIKLDEPIANAGTTDFLLRRQNTSRGHYRFFPADAGGGIFGDSSLSRSSQQQRNEEGGQLAKFGWASVSPTATQMTRQLGSRKQSDAVSPYTQSPRGHPNFPPQRNISSTSLLLRQGSMPMSNLPGDAYEAGGGDDGSSAAGHDYRIFGRYPVERLHRIKPRWPAWLLVYAVQPSSPERKRWEHYLEVVRREHDADRRNGYSLQRESSFHGLAFSASSHPAAYSPTHNNYGEAGACPAGLLTTGRNPKGSRKEKKSREALNIHFGQLGSVEVLPAERGSATRILCIVWLKVLPAYLHLLTCTEHDAPSAVIGANAPSTTSSGFLNGGHRVGGGSQPSLNLQHQLAQAYAASEWKTLQLEANADDAWKAGTQLNELRNAFENSHHSGENFFPRARILYGHSERGTWRPLLAAQHAFGITPVLAPEPLRTPEGGGVEKGSQETRYGASLSRADTIQLGSDMTLNEAGRTGKSRSGAKVKKKLSLIAKMISNRRE